MGIYIYSGKNTTISWCFLISIFLPEVTTPLLNVWQLSKMKNIKFFIK